MLLKIIARNIALRLKKYLLLLLIVASAIGILFVVNSVFEQIEIGQKRAFVDSITGQYSISEKSEDSSTIFGSSIPIIGLNNYIKPIDSVDKLRKKLESNPSIENISFTISTFGLVSVDDANEPSVLFGVDIETYKKSFKELRIESNKSFENPKGPYIFLARKIFESLQKRRNKPLNLGDKILVTSSNGESFAIRELVLTGVLDYGISDEQVSRLSLIDASSARAISGMLVSQEKTEGIDASRSSIATGEVKEIDDSGFLLSDLEKELKADESQGEESQSGVQTWNYCTFGIKNGYEPGRELEEIKRWISSESLNLQVRDWRETAGGGAQLVSVIQLVINFGIVIIIIAAILILNNSIGISVFERSAEIGTMRALGAQKGFVISIIGLELLILILIASLVGIFVASLGSVLFIGQGVKIVNPLFVSLLGANTFVFVPTIQMIGLHLMAGLGIGVLSLFNPLRIAISISPREAMRIE